MKRDMKAMEKSKGKKGEVTWHLFDFTGGKTGEFTWHLTVAGLPRHTKIEF
tara:strand:+ start:447 stop:599 length:153 start_codon:yes stop_codon:yes gene_type:complete